MGGDPIKNLSPLAAELRIQDPDRYLTTLFAPAENRPALFALYAFDHEIAKVRRLVREPMAGLVRLQWWRDALDGIEKDDVVPHPVVHALHQAKRCLDRQLLLRAIDGRERELEGAPPSDMDRLERHLAATGGSIVEAAAVVLGGTDRKVGATVEKVGLAVAALELLSWLGKEATERPLWLPRALLDRHDVSAEASLDGDGQGKIETARKDLAGWAREQLAIARNQRTMLPRWLLPALFPGTLADIRLRDVISGRQRPAIAGAPIRLLWCRLRGVF